MWGKRNLFLFFKKEENTAWLYVKKDNSGGKGNIGEGQREILWEQNSRLW